MTIRANIAQKTFCSILSFSCLVSLSSAEPASATCFIGEFEQIQVELAGHGLSVDSTVQIAEDPELIELEPGGYSLNNAVRVAEDPELIELEPGGYSLNNAVRVAEDPELIELEPGGRSLTLATS